MADQLLRHLAPEGHELVPYDINRFALSHIALPFPPDDPLYGRYPPADPSQVFLGQLAIRGETGVLKLPGNWLLRQRHNPFFDYQQQRILEWFDQNRRGQADLDRADEGRKVTSLQRSPGSTDFARTALPLTRSRRVWTKT